MPTQSPAWASLLAMLLLAGGVRPGLAQNQQPPPPPPGINCETPKTSSERTVCRTAKLAKWETDRHDVFKRVWDGATDNQRAQMRRQHDAWDVRRNACAVDRVCLSRIYTERLGELQRGQRR